MLLDLTELSSYLPSVSCFEFGNAFSILFPCTEGRVRTRMTSAGTPRAGAFCHCHSSRRAAASQRRLSHRDETHCLPRRAPWRAPVVQEEGQRSCCAGPAVWLKGAAAGAQQQRWRAAQAHHTPAKPRVISRQNLAPKWHFSVHLATWSRREAPSFWE